MLVVEDLEANIGRVPVLRGVSLKVAPGQTVALLGRNGVGKTTTLKAIAGWIKQITGGITYNGRSIGGLEPNHICRLGIGPVAG